MVVDSKKAQYKVAFFTLIAALFPFFAFIQMNILNVMGNQISHEMALNANNISLLSAIYLYADAIMLLPVGILLDRFSTKYLLIVGISLMISGILIFSGSHYLWIACIGRFIAGCGHAFSLLSCFRLVRIYFPSYQQGFMFGTIITIALLGGLMAQSPYAFLIEEFGWRSVLLMQAGLGALIGLLIVITLPSETPVFSEKIMLLSNLKTICNNKQNWLASLYICLMGIPLMILGALWGSNYLMATHALTYLQAASVTSMIFIGTIIGSPLIGFISDRVGSRRRIMLYGAILTLLTLIVVYQWHSASFSYLMVFFFLIGLFGSSQVLGYPVISENNAKEITSTAMGFTNVLIMLVIASSQLFFGWLWNKSETQFYALCYIALALIISIIISIRLKKSPII